MNFLPFSPSSLRRTAAVVLFALGAASVLPAAQAARVYVYEHEGMIYGIPSRMLQRAIKTATSSEADLFLLEINTPGGEVPAMEEMVQEILNSEVPVCVYVTPRGAHAASAGFFLLLAADVSAMAPLTRTGAASPVWQGSENKGDDVLFKKASQDLAALARTAARLRGRPPELAEKAVLDATTWSSEEALELGLIEVIAGSREELLESLDGREVIRGDGSKKVLDLSDIEFVETRVEWTDSLESYLFHPAALSLFMVVGLLGLYIEFNNPGLILPGVVGAICLLLVFFGSRGLPPNAYAVALLVLGLVLFILEIKIVSFGLLSVAGGISLATGLYLLFPGAVSGSAVPFMYLVPLTVMLVGGVGFVTWLVRRTMTMPATTGREGLVGEEGEATSDLKLEGTVFVHGEVWSARAERPTLKGQRVRVSAVEGLRLVVEPVSTVPATAAELE